MRLDQATHNRRLFDTREMSRPGDNSSFAAGISPDNSRASATGVEVS